MRATALAMMLAGIVSSAEAGYVGGDGFDDGVLDAGKWAGPWVSGPMQWREQDGQLQFRSTGADADWPTAAIRWNAFDFRYGCDWTTTVDVFNPADLLPEQAGVGEEEVASVSMVLTPANQSGSFITVFLQTKLYVYETSTRYAHRIIIGKWANNSPVDVPGDILHNFASDVASLCFRWDASAEQLEVLYDLDGGQDEMVLWHTLDLDEWAMAPSDELFVSIDGGVINAVVDWEGGLAMDNFVATSEAPEPTTALLIAGGMAAMLRRRRA